MDLHIGSEREVLVAGHLFTSIPSQGAAQLLGEFAYAPGEGGDYRLGIAAWNLYEHHESRLTFDQPGGKQLLCDQAGPVRMSGQVAMLRPQRSIPSTLIRSVSSCATSNPPQARSCCIDRLRSPPTLSSKSRSKRTAYRAALGSAQRKSRLAHSVR
jgi:hypothetical protein